MAPRMQQRLEFEYQRYEELEENYQAVLEEQNSGKYGPLLDQSEFEEVDVPEEATMRQLIFSNLAHEVEKKAKLSMKDVDEIARQIDNYDRGLDLKVLKKKWYPKVAVEQREKDRARLMVPDLDAAGRSLKRRINRI